MSPRVRSSGRLMSGAVCVLLATFAAGNSPAHAECIVQPNQQAPDGTHWSQYLDRITNRYCWILVDAYGREMSVPQAQPATGAGPSPLQSFLGNFTGLGPPPPPPQQPETMAAPAASPPRRPHRHVAHVNRPVRPLSEVGTEAPPAKHEMTPQDRDALFEEFLRWHESQKITGTDKR